MTSNNGDSRPVVGNRLMKMAVIGVGSMGRNHVRVLTELPDVKLVGVADTNLEMANLVAGKYGVPVFADYRRLFDEARPDAVVVAVPTAWHSEVALAALERDIHVLVEKPIAATIAEAEEMIALARSRGLTLGTGHIERFNPAVVELKRRLDAGELGRVFMIHARRQSPFPKRISDVGVASDLATHELDMMCFLTGSRVGKLSAEVKSVISSGREDIIFGLLRFDNGVLGIMDVNWVTPTIVRDLTITGERGMFVVNYHTQELVFHQNPAVVIPQNATDWMTDVNFTVDAGNMTRFQINRREPLASELDAFVDSARRGVPAPVDGEDGLQALRLAIDIMSHGEKPVFESLEDQACLN